MIFSSASINGLCDVTLLNASTRCIVLPKTHLHCTSEKTWHTAFAKIHTCTEPMKAQSLLYILAQTGQQYIIWNMKGLGFCFYLFKPSLFQCLPHLNIMPQWFITCLVFFLTFFWNKCTMIKKFLLKRIDTLQYGHRYMPSIYLGERLVGIQYRSVGSTPTEITCAAIFSFKAHA